VNSAPTSEPLDVGEIAERLRWSPKEVRARLRVEHAKRGRTVIFKASKSKNARWYIYPEMLAEIWPRTFGPAGEHEPLRAALDQLDAAIARVRSELRDTGP
jgi:hypothetical protein